MPGLATQHNQFRYNGFWSKHRDDVSYNLLYKFWSELPLEARQKLLKIDKQTLFEQARRNMYCSRCNGLLLEGFLQIVMYGKSLQHGGGTGHILCKRTSAAEHDNDCGLSLTNGCHDNIQDPSVHPWGGLATTRDGSLTLLDCYLHSKSIKGLQNVFDSARAREQERELLYPDACGGGGRGWISHGIATYGRGHGSRETCALHTARLSCDTLVDFWSALGEETRQSLLRMKEEDFIERLMYRFDSKRFCRDCRRNVIREFKELKELKRMRREPRCTSWFCVADAAFQYEVSDDTVLADWGNTFTDTVGAYHHFEWAVGTGEGKSDILEFENVGMDGSVQVSGLQLGGLSACFITLRAWKLDGRCTELSVKAHALKGQPCVHGRLVVCNGFVTINKGESIRKFFEHAEEAEEEEDDDSVDNDGNELDGECSRPQKHAKSPELARDFLLDAATVIFKEQVEKAFREGTARQNAHSIFVCLALKLLEERVHVACKEIITLEKQMKLLEEEEKEKREEEERRERKRTKEREKKLRRKERLKGKERDKERKVSESVEIFVHPDEGKDEESTGVDEEPNRKGNSQDSVSETGNISPCRPTSFDVQDHNFSNGFSVSMLQNDLYDSPDGEVSNLKDEYGSFTTEQSKFFSRRLRYRKEIQPDTSLLRPDRRRFAVVSESGAMVNRPELRHPIDSSENSSRGAGVLNRQFRVNGSKSYCKNCGLKLHNNFSCSNRMNDRYDSQTCSCHYSSEYRMRDSKSVGVSESALDVPKQFYRINKYSHAEYGHESFGRHKSKCIGGNNSFSREMVHLKKVWEPLDAQKKYPRSNSDSDVTSRSSAFKVGVENNIGLFKSSDDELSSKVGTDSVEVHHDVNTSQSKSGVEQDCQNGYCGELADNFHSTKAADEDVKHAGNCTLTETFDPSASSTSSSDNCSLCLSEGDSNTTSSSNHGNTESSTTSDSEDSSQQSEGREVSMCIQNDLSNCQEADTEIKSEEESVEHQKSFDLPSEGPRMGNLPTKTVQNLNNGMPVNMSSQCQGVYPAVHNQGIQFPMFQTPSTMGFYHQNPVSWPAAPANVFMPYPNPYYSGPLGYGPNGDLNFCMQYGPMQHLSDPMFNPNPVPFCRPVAQANGINTDGKSTSCTNLETFNETKHERVAPASPCPKDLTADGGCGSVDNSAKMQQSNAGFSLFHFGGPVALTSGSKAYSTMAKDALAGNFSSILLDQVVTDPDCNKENTMEEYNLFAASNGLSFSIF